MSQKNLKKIRKRHEFFKSHFSAKPEWRAELSVADLDFLLEHIDRLSEKKNKSAAR
jgi:hypothetical protein